MEWFYLTLIFVLGILVLYLLYRLKIKNSKPEKKAAKEEKTEEVIPATSKEFSDRLNRQVMEMISEISGIYSGTIRCLEEEDRLLLKKRVKEVKQLSKLTKIQKEQSLKMVKTLDKDLIISGSHAAQVYDYIREAAYCLNYITNPSFIHVNNVHNPIPDERLDDLRKINSKVADLFVYIIEKIKQEKLSIEDARLKLNPVKIFLEKERNVQSVNIKDADMNTRTTMLYMGIMHETKNMLVYLENFVVAYDEFVKHLPRQ